jgi:hypothetical protein
VKPVICCPDSADDLAIGVYGEDTSAGGNAGAVHILVGDEVEDSVGLTAGGQEYLTQSGPGQAGAEFGYALGAGYYGTTSHGYLAIGAPLTDVGSATDAGAISIRYFGTTGTDADWTQDSTDVLDQAETGDQLGSWIAGLRTTAWWCSRM